MCFYSYSVRRSFSWLMHTKIIPITISSRMRKHPSRDFYLDFPSNMNKEAITDKNTPNSCPPKRIDPPDIDYPTGKAVFEAKSVKVVR